MIKVVKLKPYAVKNELGIENIKLILALILQLVTRIQMFFQNPNWFAGAALAQEIFQNLSTLRQWRVALAEAQDLIPAEAQELSAFFNLKFDIESDMLEMLIEEGVALIPEAYNLILTNINFGARVINLGRRIGGLQTVELKFMEQLPKSIDLQAAA